MTPGRPFETAGLAYRFISFWGRAFYIALALAFTMLVYLDLTAFHFTTEMRQATFDLMVRHRVVTPKPDPGIVIVDINEESLATMASEFGRWPWPRQVLGEFLEHLQEQRPRAVVFDMLFSDPDLYNPESDSYFDAAVSRYTNTFFPFLRLDERTDSESRINPSMIPGIVPLSADAQPTATIGVVLPHFEAILRGGRLGINNIYPDPDGVAREYVVYRNDYGWKVPSLPLRVVQELGYPTPSASQVLLNWRGPPFTYHVVSFSQVFNDMTSQVRQRPRDEFTDKIVIIGSTAPSLFDVKPTPMSRLHPGVEILATAIDNLLHADYLIFPDRQLFFLTLTMLMIWSTAIAFHRNVGRERIDSLFGASQFILLAIGFATINFSRIYIDLTGPVTMGLAYFTIARVYGAIAGRLLEPNVFRRSEAASDDTSVVLLLINAARARGSLKAHTPRAIRDRVSRMGSEPKNVAVLTGRQEGIWALFNETVAVSWMFPVGDTAARARVLKDTDHIVAFLPTFLPGRGDENTNWILHEGTIAGGSGARNAWRALFADALLRWRDQIDSPDGGSQS